MRFRKRPVEVEAVQLGWDTWGVMCGFLGDIISEDTPGRMVGDKIELTIPTLEGDMIAHHGDWIIKGVAGEFYPCRPDIFDQTYEKVDG